MSLWIWFKDSSEWVKMKISLKISMDDIMQDEMGLIHSGDGDGGQTSN